MRAKLRCRRATPSSVRVFDSSGSSTLRDLRLRHLAEEVPHAHPGPLAVVDLAERLPGGELAPRVHDPDDRVEPHAELRVQRVARVHEHRHPHAGLLDGGAHLLGRERVGDDADEPDRLRLELRLARWRAPSASRGSGPARGGRRRRRSPSSPFARRWSLRPSSVGSSTSSTRSPIWTRRSPSARATRSASPRARASRGRRERARGGTRPAAASACVRWLTACLSSSAGSW